MAVSLLLHGIWSQSYMNVSDTVSMCFTVYDAEKEAPMRKDNGEIGSIYSMLPCCYIFQNKTSHFTHQQISDGLSIKNMITCSDCYCFFL